MWWKGVSLVLIGVAVLSGPLLSGCGTQRERVVSSPSVSKEPRTPKTARKSTPDRKSSVASKAPSIHFLTLAENRREREQACLRSGLVRENRFISSRSSLGGPGSCGAVRPFTVSAADSGRVRLRPAAMLQCGMIPAVDAWISDAVTPAAMRHLGSPVVGLKIAASYSCRRRNSNPFAKMSEHAYANAIDIAAFDLADGRRITVRRGWRGGRGESRFLREIHSKACSYFTTVLGPSADKYHQDHFHFDLARHNPRKVYHHCR